MSETSSRTYSNATIVGLMTLARGYCYWPECQTPTMRMVNGSPVLNVDIAHIRAASPNGPRFDPALSKQERDEFSNLILLCTVHHKTVDGKGWKRYPIELLEQWKEEREAGSLDQLAGLSDLTEEKLSLMLAQAQSELLDRVGPALDAFAESAPDLAVLLRSLTDELADPRVHGFGISEDVAIMLNDSAWKLSGLEDNAMLLARAADKLANLGDNAGLLAGAASDLSGLPDLVRLLDGVTRRLQQAVDRVGPY
ncbi:hypothetical protein [Streptomyces mirabilis]|uniref:HNH endonuclease n=1 Tax=Streptomyces mirabilis TaxID=68239 RepID=A0ABU3UKQ6_9ACTN|nr:hypothetical protein [Streptomyces mirabilis]MDU8994504.1 hypothetical protein [Streptomyces mirabilis]